MTITTYSDGGARGNPGPAAAGVVLFNSSTDQLLHKEGVFLGDNMTNNEAEYRALLIALTRAIELSPKQIICNLDSELVVKQLNGQYRVKNASLRKHYDEVCALRSRVPVLKFNHVPREKNALADSLVNKVLDERES